jgi:pre-rRNA-processing protein TSR3|tara:strand:+ start:3068 stop:3565 length:498 start_codon:yes stop_codon:yes gene_type:complete
MKINLLMFYQDDPKKCTAAKLIKFGLAKKITKSQSKTVLLHPYSEKTLFNHEKSLFNSITGIDCSWTLAEQVFQKDFAGISRKLPPLLAGNPVNYSKINKLTTVEAIAGAAFILGDELLSKNLLEKFNWGHTFLELNENLLHDYQKANSENEIIEIIREYGYEYN